MRDVHRDLESTVEPRRAQTFSCNYRHDMPMQRNLAAGSARAAQRQLVTFRIHCRVTLAAVEREDCVIVYRKAKVQRQHDSPDLRVHKVARRQDGNYERSTESTQGLLPRPVVDERIWWRPPGLKKQSLFYVPPKLNRTVLLGY
jgi:hypothetical protein